MEVFDTNLYIDRLRAKLSALPDQPLDDEAYGVSGAGERMDAVFDLPLPVQLAVASTIHTYLYTRWSAAKSVEEISALCASFDLLAESAGPPRLTWVGGHFFVSRCGAVRLRLTCLLAKSNLFA